jgi:hypothetical protein
MNQTNINSPFDLSYIPLGATNNIFTQNATSNIDAVNAISDWQNFQYDAKDMLEIVDCLKAAGLLDDVTPSDQQILDEFCDDLKLPPSERRFSSYAARRMSDFITRRFSLLPHQSKSNMWSKPIEEDAFGSGDTSRCQQSADQGFTQGSNMLAPNQTIKDDMNLHPSVSMLGQNLDLQYNTSNISQLLGDMNAQLYLAIHDRLQRLKKEEIQLHLLLQTCSDPFQSSDNIIPLLDLNQGLDLERQRHLRRMSLLAVAEAIGLPPQEILNFHLNRKDPRYPLVDSADLNQVPDYSRNMLSGEMNFSLPVDRTSSTNYRIDKPPPLTEQRDSLVVSTNGSVLNKADVHYSESNKPEDQQEQRRGSLDLLGTVAAAASENNSPNTFSTMGIPRQESKINSAHDESVQLSLNLGPSESSTNHPSFLMRPFDFGKGNVPPSTEVHEPTSVLHTVNQENHVTNISIRKARDNLKQAMLKSQASQRNIQKWDKQFGLKRSHSMTMTKTTKSRNQLKAMLEQIK